MVINEQQMANSDFLAEVYGDLDGGIHGWVCTFRADPSNAGPEVWGGRLYKGTPQQAASIDRAQHDNTYFCTAVLTATADGEIVRRKDAFVRLAVLVLDDVQIQEMQGYSYAIQTSPGKHQVGILIDREDPDAQDRRLVDLLMQALATRGYIKADRSGNNAVRYVRLPVGRNTKPRAAGEWAVQMETWNPSIRWSLEDACAAIGIDLDNLKAAAQAAKAKSTTTSPLGQGGQGVHAGEMIAGLVAPLGERVYHESITRLAASLVAGGMFPGAAVEHLRSLMEAVRPTGPEEEVRRWQARYDEIERAVRSAEKFAPEERKPPSITVNLGGSDQAEPKESDIRPLDLRVLEVTKPEPVTWALDGWLPHGQITLLSANGGVGKSNLSLQLTVSIAAGQPFMGIPTQQGRVMFISAEDDARMVHLRLHSICKHAGVRMQDIADDALIYDITDHDTVMWRDGHPTERLQWLADTVANTKPSVVILDNASDVFADNENDRTVVRGFMHCLKRIAKVHNLAVLLLAHVDKASVRMGAGADTSSTYSGSTAWHNSARSRWAMVRSPDKREVVIRHEKCTVGPEQQPLSVEYDSNDHVFRLFGTVPGAAQAAALMRNGQRAAILKLIDQADRSDQKLSMSAQANNNAYRVLKAAPGFPNIQRSEFFSLLFDLQREGLIEEVEYINERKTFKRVRLTQTGQSRAAIGSGAPPIWAQRQERRDD